MIGMPDYDNYVEHMRVNHPDQTPMTYEEFSVSGRTRYGGKGGALLLNLYVRLLNDSTF